MKKLYFIQDKRSIVGNSVMWWARNSKGYTLDIRAAQIFNEEETRKICDGRDTDIPFLVDDILPLAQLHIDVQDLRPSRKRPHTLERLTE